MNGNKKRAYGQGTHRDLNAVATDYEKRMKKAKEEMSEAEKETRKKAAKGMRKAFGDK